MMSRGLAHSVWAAVGEIEDHFHRLGGAACYPGFDDTDPAFLVGLLIQLEAGDRGALTGVRSGGAVDRDRLNRLFRELAATSQDLRDCLYDLRPWDPTRFPDSVLDGVIRRLALGLTDENVPEADVAEYVAWISKRMPTADSRRWRLFCKYILTSPRGDRG